MELKTRDKIIVVVLVIVALAVFFGGRYRDNHTHFTTEKWVSAVGNDRQKKSYRICWIVLFFPA